jgi:putative N6-adenine-specific DNA methylase
LHSKNGMIGTMICLTISLIVYWKENFITYKGFDKASAVSKAKDNIKNANLEEYITIEEKNFDTENDTRKLHGI